MPRAFLKLVLAALVAIGVQGAVAATVNGSADEARAMVEKAARLIEAEGKEKAFREFNDLSGAFVDRDLFVFVLNMDGVTVSHGANRALIGKSLVNLQDADGKPFVQEMLEIAKAGATGWVDYNWANAQTRQVELKSIYIKKVRDVLVGVSVHKGERPES